MATFDPPLDQHRSYPPVRDEPADFDAFWLRTLDGIRCTPLDLTYNVVQYGLATVDVCNVGTRAADEVVQLYARDNVASVARPDQILLGFVRVPLAPDQTKRVTFTVHPSRLAFYDPRMRFVTEPGTFTFRIGASAVDIRAEQIVELRGEVAEYRQREVVATSVAVE